MEYCLNILLNHPKLLQPTWINSMKCTQVTHLIYLSENFVACEFGTSIGHQLRGGPEINAPIAC